LGTWGTFPAGKREGKEGSEGPRSGGSEEFTGLGADRDRPGKEVGNLETTAKTKTIRSMIYEVSQNGIGKRSRLGREGHGVQSICFQTV